MNSRTVDKILRNVFVNKQEHCIKLLEDKKKAIKVLKDKITNKSPEFVEVRELYKDDDDFLITLQFSQKRTEYWDSFVYLSIRFDEKDRLVISHNTNKYNFSGSFDEFLVLTKAFEKEFDQINKRKEKRNKVKKLKKSAILANIKEIAKEMEFDFYLKEFETKIKLFIKIGDCGLLDMDIPYSKFQKIIPEIKETIEKSREIDKFGFISSISFSPQNKNSRYIDFIKYKEL